MTDLLLDDNMDLQIENNDLAIGKSDQQHMQLLLLIPKGGFKENTTATVGAQNYLESESTADFLREVRLRFSQDGCTLTQCGFDTNGNLQISGGYAD